MEGGESERVSRSRSRRTDRTSRYSSYSGYGKIGFDRRFRIYDISEFGETIRTYKRTEHDEILDDMILAGRGAPPAYEGVV